MLTEKTLQNATIDDLLDLMVEKIRIQKSLHVRFDDVEYKKLKTEIKLIQAEIDRRKHADTQGDPPAHSHLRSGN